MAKRSLFTSAVFGLSALHCTQTHQSTPLAHRQCTMAFFFFFWSDGGQDPWRFEYVRYVVLLKGLLSMQMTMSNIQREFVCLCVLLQEDNNTAVRSMTDRYKKRNGSDCS